MKNNLIFHWELLKERPVILMVSVIAELIFMIFGLTWSYIPLAVVFDVIIAYHAFFFLIIMKSMYIHTDRKGAYITTAEVCAYFPTTRKVFYQTKAIISFLILGIQLAVTAVAAMLCIITSQQAASGRTYLIGMLLCLIAILGMSAMDMLITVPMWKYQTAVGMAWFPAFFFGGAMMGFVSAASDEITLKITGIACLITLLIWLCCYVLAKILTEKSNI